MTINLKKRNFLKLLDYTPAEIQYLIDLAIKLKAAKKPDEKTDLGWQNIALILEKPPPVPAVLSKWLRSTKGRR